jgi:hypothetical protein
VVERPELRKVVALLSALDADLLRETGCWFAGGTAIALRCGEYRLSRDVDFLCASREGYRKLREVVFDHGLSGLFTGEVKALRPLRADRYGIRAVVEVEGVPVKLEIVSEGRIPLSGVDDGSLPVARLTDEDLVAEKLLANADRYLDDSALGRDALDLIVLQHHLGALPESAKEKARAAYGGAIDRALERGLQRLRDNPEQLERALDTLDVLPAAREVIRARLSTIAPSPTE